MAEIVKLAEALALGFAASGAWTAAVEEVAAERVVVEGVAGKRAAVEGVAAERVAVEGVVDIDVVAALGGWKTLWEGNRSPAQQASTLNPS